MQGPIPNGEGVLVDDCEGRSRKAKGHWGQKVTCRVDVRPVAIVRGVERRNNISPSHLAPKQNIAVLTIWRTLVLHYHGRSLEM